MGQAAAAAQQARLAEMTSQPKSGSPATVEIADDQWNTLLAPLNLPTGLIALVLGTFSSVTVDVPTLCAVDPPTPEVWTLTDFMRFFDPSSNAAAVAKLRRMAEADLWSTYCEYTTPTDIAGYTGTPVKLRADLFAELAGGNPDFTFQIDQTGTDLWVFLMTCVTPSSDGGKPYLTVNGPAAGHFPNLGTFPNASGSVLLYAATRAGGYHDQAGTGSYEWWPNDGNFVVQMPPTDGQWILSVDAWRLTILPPAIVPWPNDPLATPGNQFSDQCAIDLCTMAASWSAAQFQFQAIASDLTVTRADVEAAAAVGDAAKAELDTILLTLGDPLLRVTHFDPDALDNLQGRQAMNIPVGTIGACIEATVPEQYSQSSDDPFIIWWDIGYVFTGTHNFWQESHRLKNGQQWVPFTPGTRQFGIDLAPGVSLFLRWLRAGP